MSDTDDTDILLLIPPNFFLVHSSESEDSLLDSSRTVVHNPLPCTSQVLGQLVTQVHSLENRLESLELSAASDSLSSREAIHSCNKSWDYYQTTHSHSKYRKYLTFPRRRKRKAAARSHRRENSITSLDSVRSYIKNIPSLPLKDYVPFVPEVINDSRSMDGDISSIVSSPNKKNDKLLLNEIDEFLNKVEAYESPETKLRAPDPDATRCPESVIRATGNYLAQKLDAKYSSEDIKLPSGRVIPSDYLDKYIYLARNDPDSKSDKENYRYRSEKSNNSHLSNPEPASSERSEVTLKSNQDLSKASYVRSPIVRKLNFTHAQKDVQPTSTPKKTADKNSAFDRFRPSTNKVYDKASKILEQYKARSRDSDCTVNTSALNSPKKEEFRYPPSSRHYGSDHREGTQKFIDSIDTGLLSLSDLWGAKAQAGSDRDSGKLEEERLKREHCEVMIQDLQRKLLDQQERLAVAVKVDRSKDAAIGKLREGWLKVTGSLERAEARHRAALDKMAIEVEQYKTISADSRKKTEHFEAELYKALDLAHDYQDKCKIISKEKHDLEENLKVCLKGRDDAINSKNVEIDNMKDNYETLMRLNKQSSECIKNIESTLDKERLEHDSTKAKLLEATRKVESMAAETTLLMQERDLVKVKVNEERARVNMLEKQLSDKQNTISAMQKREDTLDNEVTELRKQLELQRHELKCHYQRQLEEAVLAKLGEFQHQLDAAEREVERDARGKEAALVDAYNKQMSNICEQHKLEIKLLEEKQKEEMKLYRLQVAQASERIASLEGKLDTYRRRRGQIASQLHGVMQAQWRQAMHILTHPGAGLLSDHNASNTTPTPTAAPAATAPHDSTLDGLSDQELQHYVKLMLTKPPTLDGSGDSSAQPPAQCAGKDVGEEPTSDRPQHRTGVDRNRRSLNTNKPPWKS